MFLKMRSQKTLYQAAQLYKRKSHLLSSLLKEDMKALIFSLDQALKQSKDKQELTRAQQQLQAFLHEHFPKSLFKKGIEFISAIAFAIILATVIRQMWFEPFVIPSGSMRPTLQEEDHLIVSKTSFGLNIPLTPGHLYFDSSQVSRGTIFVFTAEGIEVSHPDTLYFHVFPGKKRLVKRCLGKPNETLYFYEGLVHGLDQNNTSFIPYQLPNLEWIPFLNFEGKVVVENFNALGYFTKVTFYQMNIPVASLLVTPGKEVIGKMLQPVNDLYDLWGFKHYAMTRLLTIKEAKELYNWNDIQPEGTKAFLLLSHHPSIHQATLGTDEHGRIRPKLSLQNSLIPLTQEHLDSIKSHLSTSRFVVQNGMAYPYQDDGSLIPDKMAIPVNKTIASGTYEFENGVPYEIVWGGMQRELPQNHPLNTLSLQELKTFFNAGVQFFNVFDYNNPHQIHAFMPHRYAYFRDENLYLMGHPILKANDPILKSFIEKEKTKSTFGFYPLEASKVLAKDTVQKTGLKIPPDYYVGLGDNHAVSGDSREFGFIPAANLEGSPSLILWPPGDRFGKEPLQPKLPQSPSRATYIVWALALLASLTAWLYEKRKYQNVDLNL